jgi:hypothetical protein
MVTKLTALLISLLFPLISGADTLLFDNGADLHIFTTLNSINQFHQVTDDFVLNSAATLDRVVFGETTLGSATSTPTAVDWSIGTSQFSASVASGAGATITAEFTGFNNGDERNFSSSFALPNLSLGPGTYWLTLGNGTDSFQNNTYWSVSSTSAGNAQTVFGFPPAPPAGVSDLTDVPSFQIYGTVPEPGSLLLLVSAGLACAAVCRRRSVALTCLPRPE